MFETVRKLPGVWLLIAFGAAVTALVDAIGGLEKLREIYENYSPVIRGFTPVLYHGLLIYYATALIVISYGKWKERKSLHEKKRRDEIKEIKEQAQIAGEKIMAYFGPERTSFAPETPQQAIDNLIRVLVKAAAYEHRVELFGLVNQLRAHNPVGWTFDPSYWNSKISPALDLLGEWIFYARKEAAGWTPSFRMKDPLATPPVQDDGYIPPDPHGVNKYLYPTKERFNSPSLPSSDPPRSTASEQSPPPSRESS